MLQRFHLRERLERAQRRHYRFSIDAIDPELDFDTYQAFDLDAESNDGEYRVYQRGNTRYKASRW